MGRANTNKLAIANDQPAPGLGRLAISYVRIDELSADPRNPRIHTDKQVRQVAKSIQTFGWNVPMVVDGSGRVICGHGRLLAARLLGMTEVPVVRVDHLTPAQARAFQIADNKLTENSRWDAKLLGEQLRDLSIEGLDFDLTVTGFEIAEIDIFIDGLSDEPPEDDDPDEAPVPPGPLVTQPGDVWTVLGHRIWCADGLSVESWDHLLAGEPVAMVFSDPPYNVKIQGNAAGFGKIQYDEFAMASGEMTEEQFVGFLLASFERMAAVCAPGALAYICMDWRGLLPVLAAGRKTFHSQKNLCVWTKPQGGQGSFYRSQHEMVVVFQARPGAARNNVKLGSHGRNRTNVWAYGSPSAFGRAGEEGRLTEDHPTPKPVAMVADAILDCTARGDLVLDPFLGGGATLMAAERTGRRCAGIEIEPRYVDACLRRIRRMTGEDPRRLSDGRLFSELEAEAGDGEEG